MCITMMSITHLVAVCKQTFDNNKTISTDLTESGKVSFFSLTILPRFSYRNYIVCCMINFWFETVAPSSSHSQK